MIIAPAFMDYTQEMLSGEFGERLSFVRLDYEENELLSKANEVQECIIHLKSKSKRERYRYEDSANLPQP